MDNFHNTFKSLIFAVLVGGTTMGIIPICFHTYFGSPTNNTIGLLRCFGFFPLPLGIIMISWCVRDFLLRGKGTPAPFDPPKQLVVTGLFQFMRNPIITGAIMVLVGESILMESIAIGVWVLIFFVVNHLWLLFWEEPGLIQRFGEDYKIYMKDVPRWFPIFTNITQLKMKNTDNS